MATRPSRRERLARAYLAELRNPARHDALGWLQQQLPDTFSLPFAPVHEHLAGLLRPQPYGLRAVVGAPRGVGKSTFATLGLSLVALQRRTHWFHVLLRARSSDANASLDAIEATCEALARRYPHLLPVRRTGGELRLHSGAVVLARGSGAAIRGLQRRLAGRIIRPDLVIGDDLETDRNARSPEQVRRLTSWVHGTLGQLGSTLAGQPRPLDLLLVGTTLQPQSMLTRALGGVDEWNAWHRTRFPAEARLVDGVLVDTQGQPVPWQHHRGRDGDRVPHWPDGMPIEHLDRLTDPQSMEFIGSLLYAQEYLLDPRSSTSVLFPDRYTRWERPDVRRHPGPAWQYLVRCGVGVDSAASKRDAADYSAVVPVQLLLRPDGTTRDLYIPPAADRRRVELAELMDWCEKVATAHHGTVAFESNGGFLWGAKELRRRGKVPVRPVHAQADKRTRAQPMTLWHEARRLIVDPALRRTAFDTEFHSFTGDGDLHDDLVDGAVHGAALATNGWRDF